MRITLTEREPFRKLPWNIVSKGVAMNRNKEACHCKNITYGMIEDAIRAGAQSAKEVEEITRFGTGCGKCREFIEYLVQDILTHQKANG